MKKWFDIDFLKYWLPEIWEPIRWRSNSKADRTPLICYYYFLIEPTRKRVCDYGHTRVAFKIDVRMSDRILEVALLQYADRQPMALRMAIPNLPDTKIPEDVLRVIQIAL